MVTYGGYGNPAFETATVDAMRGLAQGQAKRDADYGNDREQSQQLLNGMLVRLEGVEGVVEKQGGRSFRTIRIS